MPTSDTQPPQNHPIEGLMTTAMENLKQMVDVNTVVGDAVEANDGTVIIPLSQVAFGFAAGGGEYEVTGGEARGNYLSEAAAGRGIFEAYRVSGGSAEQ